MFFSPRRVLRSYLFFPIGRAKLETVAKLQMTVFFFPISNSNGFWSMFMKLLVRKNIVNKSSELNADDRPNCYRQKITEYKDNVKYIQKLSIEANCAKKNLYHNRLASICLVKLLTHLKSTLNCLLPQQQRYE